MVAQVEWAEVVRRWLSARVLQSLLKAVEGSPESDWVQLGRRQLQQEETASWLVECSEREIACAWACAGGGLGRAL
jgi:prophage antirepressor-like protein